MKTNIDYKYLIYILILSFIFVFIASIFLFINIGKDRIAAMDRIIANHSMSRSSASFIYSLSIYGSYIIDWVLVVIFMVTILFSKSRFEFGFGFIYIWLSLWTVAGLFPFASPSNDGLEYVKCGLLLIPTFGIVWVLILQANELRWMRRAQEKSEGRKKYV